MDKQDEMEFYVASGVNIGIKGTQSIVFCSAGRNRDAEDEGALPRIVVDRFNSQPALVEDKKKLVEALENISESGFAQYMSMSDMIGGLKKIAIDALSAIEGA